MSFDLHDPVYVVTKGDESLEGVVVFLGSVDFSPEVDWVGVRLTGESAGQGKNDGTVKGKSYFACPPNCGIFVKRSAVTKRDITKLEELKLRRELGITKTTTTRIATPSRLNISSSSSISSPLIATATTAATTTDSSTGASTSQSVTAATAAASASSPPFREGTATQNKLEELRQRRAALHARKETTTSSAADLMTATPPTTPAASALTSRSVSTSSVDGMAASGHPQTTTPGVDVSSSPGDQQQLKMELEQAVQKLSEKEDETKKLDRKLCEMEQKVESLKQEVEAARLQTQEARREATASFGSSGSSRTDQEQHQHREEESAALGEQVFDLQLQVSDWKEAADSYRSKLMEMERQLQDQRELSDNLTSARAEASALKQEIQEIFSQNEKRGMADASHYKERAKLLAEISAQKRKVEQFEREKQELEAAVEDLTLDKEQLEQEKEALEDRLDELKLDAETAQMEVEELKIELEDVQSSSERTASAKESASGDAEDVAQALSVQNARLREALIRLREQSSIEKMELSRQLRDAEKDAEAGRAVSSELEALKALKANLEEQVNELKDMVEQGAAFETMVEDLSDRVLSIEDENIGLQCTIRELEEAAELTAEMEELQAEELKALTRDLEGRDTIIRNLEEAIKMQRRREDDFLRTVANYRTSVATLKQEKQALLELQQGGEGEKSDLIASSQSALARAAQLVSDAAEMRRREAKASMDGIEKQIYKSLSFRIESLLPQGFVGPEVSAIKGELQASKAVSVASKTLDGIASCYAKVIRPALIRGDDHEALDTDVSLNLSDDVRQTVATMLYQAEFSHIIIEVSSDLLRLLAAGQWPSLLSHDSSTDLGTRLGHAARAIDATLAAVLKSLKEEGALTPEQSNMEAVRRTLQTTIQALLSDIELDGDKPLVPSNWNPPGWELLKNASVAKFACLGVAAALSTVAFKLEHAASSRVFRLYYTIEQISSQSITCRQRLSSLDVLDDNIVSTLSGMVLEWKDGAIALMKAAEGLLLGSGDWKACEIQGETVLRDLALLTSSLRAAKMNPSESESFHAFSPESDDCWAQVAALARSIRSIDGDPDDVHFLCRARAIEQRLTSAIEKEPKLDFATSKIATLEKTLSSKVKEVSMLSARLSELEKLLAKSKSISTPVSRSNLLDYRSSEEFSALQEENRMLSEAIDVLHRQVDEYENEIRALKDFKSPGKGSRSRIPRRSLTSVADVSPYGRGSSDDLHTSTGVLEATLFRPALQRALKEAAAWKASAVGDSLSNLPPLRSSKDLHSGEGEQRSDRSDDLIELTFALADYRIKMASVSLVDLSRRDKTPRLQLRESCMEATSQRLQSVLRRCQGHSFY